MALLLVGLPAAGNAAVSYTTEEYPAGCFFVPMDSENGHQRDVAHTYAFMWRFMKAGGVLYRVIQDGTPATQLQIGFEPQYSPTGAGSPGVFVGGPFFILAEPEQVAAMEQAHNFFPNVTVDKLTTAFKWGRSLAAASPTRILVIQDKNSWGDSAELLKEMGIPFTQVGYDAVRANPQAYINAGAYDVIIDECGGWCILSGSKPGSSMGDTCRQALVDFATTGGMIMFNDRSLRDLEFTFPGYVGVQTNFESTRESWYETEFSFVNLNSFVTQSEFPTGTRIKLGTKVQGDICAQIYRQDVQVMLSAPDFDYNFASWPKKEGYASGAFFFEYPPGGRGLVAGFAYHNEEQKDYSRKMVFAFLGNRLIQAVVLRQPSPTQTPIPTATPIPATFVPTEVPPPTDLDISQEGEFVILRWKNPTNAELCGYHVVYSNSPTGPFKKLTNAPVKELRAPVASKQIANRIFYFAVVSVDCGGTESGYSNVVTNATLAPPTKAPTPLPPDNVVQRIGAKTVLSWVAPNHPPGIVGYNLYASKVHNGPYDKITQKPVEGTNQTFVTGAERIYYVVTTFDKLGQESGYSEEARAEYDSTNTPTFTPTPLPPPKNVHVKEKDGRIFLSWDPGSHEVQGSYVWYHPENEEEFKRLNATVVKTSEYDLAILKPDRNYNFQVTYLYAQGESARSSEVGVFLKRLPTPTPIPTKVPTITLTPTETPIFFLPPSAPLGVKAHAEDGHIALSWTKHTDKNVTHYNVYQSTASGTGYLKAKGGGGVKDIAFNEVNLGSGVKYYFVVTAVNAAKQESAFSKEVSATP